MVNDLIMLMKYDDGEKRSMKISRRKLKKVKKKDKDECRRIKTIKENKRTMVKDNTDDDTPSRIALTPRESRCLHA